MLTVERAGADFIYFEIYVFFKLEFLKKIYLRLLKRFYRFVSIKSLSQDLKEFYVIII
ncbi:hypothetical protein LEP1GSC074_3800 [Leptospira noguchii str. Hook]|nr:hypothetical protein LEP1GSC074_3800 [Leptospira noguchii str. Hook]